jgi:transcriptional regulator GlxA family with amidase domain
VCGTCSLDHPAAESVLELLPPIVVSRTSDPKRRSWTSATLTLLEQHVFDGAVAASTNLTDSMFAYVLGEEAARPRAPAQGLIAAARDPHVGKALSLVHRDPAAAWSAEKLAAAVGMSRTRFFGRFTELLGEPPAKYVARFRVLAAADLLRHERISTREIASRVGYGSEDALARAFKRHLGVTPGEYQRAHAPS